MDYRAITASATMKLFQYQIEHINTETIQMLFYNKKKGLSLSNDRPTHNLITINYFNNVIF